MSLEYQKLGDVADFIRGITYKPNDLVDNFSEGSTVCMRTANVQVQLKQDDLLSVPTNLVKNEDKFLIEGDILVSTANSWNLVGKCCWIPKLEYSATAGGFISILRANQEKLDQRYLYHWFNSPNTQLLARNCGRQTTNISNMDLDRCLSIKIPLPPLAEQRRIASILDQADELRQKRQQAIEKLDQLLQATFIDMFGDPASNPKGWNLGKLGDVIHSAKDGPHVSPNYSETGIPFLSTRHVRAGKIVWDDLKFITEEDAQIHWKKCKPTRGDILYTKGGTTGLAAVVDTDLDFAVWVHVALLKTNHDKVRSEWLVSMLNTQYCYEQSQRYTHGIANRDLGLKRMVNIEMYIPSLDEQDKFVNFKNKLMKNNLLFENSNSYFEQLFKSLQNQAFNGTL